MGRPKKEIPPKSPDKPRLDFFKGVKVPIKHIIKNPEINIPKINNAVRKCHHIVIHTLMFMKLYLLDYYEKNHTLPIIDDKFILTCMKVMCKETTTGRPPSGSTIELKTILKKFYQEHYLTLTKNDQLDYTNLNTVLDYLKLTILTIYENNIKSHYVEYVERYVNVIWKKQYLTKLIQSKMHLTKKERDTKIRKLNNELRKIKNDILNVENTNYTSHSSYHTWIQKQKEKLIPQKTKFEKQSIYYDIQCNPQHYFPCMIFMMKRIEQEQYKISNVFPLRSEIIPKHIRLDTTTIVLLLFTKKQGIKTEYTTKGNLKRNENKIWEFFFRTERQCFHKPNYTFHHMIETDGVSATILLVRNEFIGKHLPNNKFQERETYLDEVSNTTELHTKKIVAVDMGKNDLIYCVDGTEKDANKFRYSQDQRRKETKSKKYSKLILEFRKTKIGDKTIIEYETELSTYNKKTLNIEEFKTYIKKKNEINHIVFEFYEQYILRKLKLNAYLNTKRSEQRMIHNFQKIFGKPYTTIIAFGDWEQRQQMKYKEPTKGKGMRSLFRKYGYQTYLVDEFRSSCKCSKCNGGECSKCLMVDNPKPYRNNQQLVWGLLRCKTCNGFWNRDCNGAKNIYKIASSAVYKIARPAYLCRTISQAIFKNGYNQNLHGDEKTRP
jgi:transposase